MLEIYTPSIFNITDKLNRQASNCVAHCIHLISSHANRFTITQTIARLQSKNHEEFLIFVGTVTAYSAYVRDATPYKETRSHKRFSEKAKS